MQNMGFEDLRVFERFPVKLAMKYLDLGSNKEGQAQTMDISAKGIGVTTNAMLSPNTSVEMWLKVPDRGDPLYTRGEVVWSQMVGSNNFRSGVNLDKADLMGISRILRVI
ncbi:MAG: PilZ domain-containing protein [Candidatus Omnitrophota bacterium]